MSTVKQQKKGKIFYHVERELKTIRILRKKKHNSPTLSLKRLE